MASPARKATGSWAVSGIMVSVLLWMLVAVNAQTPALLSCPPNWTLHGDRCFRLYTTLLSWQSALQVCRTDGAYIGRIEDAYTNDFLGSIASLSSVENFWIGLNRISVAVSNNIYSQWSDGTSSSIYQAFWDRLQPDLSAGDCVYVSQTQGEYRWSFSPCEWKRAFVCDLPACPSGSFQCSTAECIQSSRTCDGIQDCKDGSDEIDCPSLCKEYTQGAGGSILSVNYPGGYPIFSDCQWTIEGPLGSNIVLKVNNVDTEAGIDELVIMAGGRTQLSSYNLARFSGSDSPSPEFRSANNFMIVRFYSNGAVQGTGFNLSWSAVSTGVPDIGQQLTASSASSSLSVPTNLFPYFANQENLWIISANFVRNIIVLKREEMDLAPGDYIKVRDGADASAPLLAEYSGTTGPLYVMSTSPQLYILLKTGRNADVSNRKFQFRYSTECLVVLSEDTGELFSPGYGVVNYANYITCTYDIHPSFGQRTTLIFDSQYDIEYKNDHLQAYIGSVADGLAMHSEADGGFTGLSAPRPFSSNTGRMTIIFQTNAVDSKVGWRATYSIGCPVPTFTPETILSTNFFYDYGQSANVSCPLGYVFDALEFYSEINGSMVSMDSVYMECLFGGVWNIRKYPQCIARYCGQAPEITNGYVESATGAVYGSTASYICAEGFSAMGNSTISCQADGTWQTPPICAAMTCPAVSTTIASGTVQLLNGDGTGAGSVYSYTCDDGYVTSGPAILYCNSSGLWSHPVPSCQKIQCLVPTLANGAVLSGNRSFVDYDSTIPLLCNEPGFQLVGSFTIKCQANRTFTSIPECVDVNECSNSSICPINSQCTNTDGSYTCTCRSGYQQNVAVCDNINECSSNNGGCSDFCVDTEGSYSCQCPNGYSLYTPNVTMGYVIPATETGIRYGDTYYIDHTCVRNQCPTPNPIANGYLTVKQMQYNFGDSITFSCSPGFVLDGQTTLLCQANGTWSGDIPTCNIAKCPADQLPQNLLNPPQSISPAGDVDYGSSVTITCNVSGISVFYKTRTCRFEPGERVYRLQGDSYECGVIDCGQPILPEGGLAFQQPTSTRYGDNFQFNCNFLYDEVGTNFLGSDIITCATDSNWSFFNITCIERQCPYPEIPAGGNITFEGSGFQYYDNVTYSCLRDGFEPSVRSGRCGVSENGQGFSWGVSSPVCVDTEPPTFVDCPSSPVIVARYSSAGFDVPTASDNSGSVANISVNPGYFYPTQPITEDITVYYTATDHAGLTAQCDIDIVVRDSSLPSIQCPGGQVLTLSANQTSSFIYDPASAGVIYNSSDAVLTFSASVPLNFSYASVGTTSVVTASVTDASGNNASCQFQVVVEALSCEPETISSSNTRRICTQTISGGYSCTFICNNGYYFYEDYGTESFTSTCEPNQPWSPSYVPSCVSSAPVEYNMVISLQYSANQSETLSESCQQSYNSSLLSVLRSSGATFKQLCNDQTDIVAVTYNEGSLQFTYNNNTQQLGEQFSVLFEEQGQSSESLYLQCFINIQSDLLKLASDTATLQSLRTLSTDGCSNVTGIYSASSAERTCSSDYKFRQVNGVPVCLPCPPGTSKSSTGVCELCPVGQYWVPSAAPSFGQCNSCSRGQTTADEGSIGTSSCLELCDGNFVSSSSFPPCNECTGNSFALNSTNCQQCPSNTLALRKENPLNQDCNTNVCTYNPITNVQMLSPAIRVQFLTVAECENLCDQWENLPLTFSKCVGFNFEKISGFCILFDQESGFATNLNYDYYERRCTEKNLTDCYCAPECAAGYYSLTGHEPNCLPCPVGFYSTSAGSKSCEECPAGQTTVSQAATGCVADAASLVCQTNPCQNNGICSVLLHDAYCSCQPGYTGRYCEQVINNCDSSPCYNSGTCIGLSQGFFCACPLGFSGTRCEENIDDCTASSCNNRGTCIDGVNSFTCNCVKNFAGSRCEQQILDGCDLFPCSGNSTCIKVNDFHRRCDCFPGFTGPLCDTEIDECESQPCLNGGTCTDKINGYDCACRSSFTGDRCQLPAKLCATTSCGVADRCVDNPVTGLPLCICRSGYTQGKLCQYSFNIDRSVTVGDFLESRNVSDMAECRSLCDARGDQCQDFVYDATQANCTLYSKVTSTTSVNATIDGQKSLSMKQCTYPKDDFFYTEWFNTMNAETSGSDIESFSTIQAYGMKICEDTEPVSVECRVAGTQTAIPSGVVCELSGLQCILGQNIPQGGVCPDMEIRYLCARSRVFEGQLCSVRDVCREQNMCVNSTCINDPDNVKGYQCVQCKPGYTGDLCQLTTDECASQPCQNNGTCIDGVLTYTCDCLPGFYGTQCELNPNDCSPSLCDTMGSVSCTDGLDDYICDCRPGYTGKNCSVNIDECASNPCFHGATCVDGVNGYSCVCPDGWTGLHCNSVLDQCNPISPCANDANCTALFNGFTCNCPSGIFGTRCEQNPSAFQCTYNNPCIRTFQCSLNGSQAICNCPNGSTGVGCELFSDNNCKNTICLNGATCSDSASGPVCSCPAGYSGDSCEINTDECASTACPSTATCIDGNNEAFCRCPVGKKAPDCTADIDENYDLCFSPSLETVGAELPYALAVSNLAGLSFMVWVRYDQAGGVGTFFTIYDMASQLVTDGKTEFLRLDESGLHVDGGSQTLTFTLFPINDGLWHLVIVFWSSYTGELNLAVDYLRQNRIQSFRFQQLITGNIWPVLGGEKNALASTNVFQGCVSGVNILSRGLNFAQDLPDLQSQPMRYQGDLLRWAEFEIYGNTQYIRPSTARLVNCVANPSEPDCVVQTKNTTAPGVAYCPDDITIDTIYEDAYASWAEPVFSDGPVSVSSNHQSGALFVRGSTEVVYIAEDQNGNTAICSFSVFVGATSCPAVKPPRGGGAQDCLLQPNGFNACTASCPASTATLVEDVPRYYTCGPSGYWETLQDQDDIYPTCGRIVGPARTHVDLHMVYRITTGLCSTITQSIVTKAQEELASVLQFWGGQICDNRDCSDVTPIVDCSTLSSTKVDIQLVNVSARVNNTVVERSIEDLWLNAVLDNNVFSFSTIIPNALLDVHSYTVQATYFCDQGEVVRDQMCVECGPGTFYNSTTQRCDNCPVGQYMQGYAALACTACPAGQTTPSIGSTRIVECAVSCPLGQFNNGTGCEICPVAFYQNETGQFECKPCPRGYLTLTEGSTSLASCAEGCQSGYELLVNGTCVPCTEGTFRQFGLNQLCTPCPPAYTTPTIASESLDNCTVLKCPAGSEANANVTGCELCPVGQYQPLPNQLDCNACPFGFTTAQMGSVQISACERFCPSGYEVVSLQCVACPVATYKDNNVNPLTSCLPCPAGYITASDSSTSLSDCSIRNCTAGFYIQSDLQGVETCALCPTDQFNPQPYQQSCLPCPNGTGTMQTGADNVTLCEAFCQSGEELVNNVCAQCPQGYYKNNSIDRFDMCTVCPAEFITATSGATSISDCDISNCTAGSYREISNNSCVACPIGTFQPDKWQTSCLPCPVEYSTDFTGASSQSQCLLSCSEGRQDQNGVCQECPVGYYKNRTGAAQCDECPPGLRSANTGSTDLTACSVVACQPGSFLNVTANTCVLCPYGQYQPDQWQDNCLSCPSNLTTLIEGATNSSQCLPDCPVGNALNVVTNICDPCERGLYRDKRSADQIACLLCPVNFITQSTGATSAGDCTVANCTAPGYYLNTQTNGCDMCPLGTYNSEWWAEACNACPSDFTTKTTGIADVSYCYRDCPSGQQVNESTNVCSQCGSGTYRNKTQTWTCQPCPTPLTTLSAGSTSVSACDIPTCGPGFYYVPAQSQCLPCAVGTYQSQSGQRSCTNCPNKKSTLTTGRTSSAECISLCDTTQNTCSADAQCSVDNSGALVCTCNTNFQGNGLTCQHVCDLTDTYCKNGASCFKDRLSPCICADYYSGPRCETRGDPSKSTSNTEVIVGTVIGVVVLILLLLLLLIGIIVRRKKLQPPSEKDSVSTSNSQSHAPSGIIPRINTQSYKNFKLEQPGRGYDPAYYNASHTDRDVSLFAFDNATYRSIHSGGHQDMLLQ